MERESTATSSLRTSLPGRYSKASSTKKLWIYDSKYLAGQREAILPRPPPNPLNTDLESMELALNLGQGGQINTRTHSNQRLTCSRGPSPAHRGRQPGGRCEPLPDASTVTSAPPPAPPSCPLLASCTTTTKISVHLSPPPL
ncbi:hypothetical protein E2C01_005272 [Portunus trituberculatus]|uniref:Uncharacterized protein n=1 Tax=Portunus trituberculatus TaxID=210409 RepID=A0A5B7CYQ5_PORTR|nr:hypothetical protein [Portunus trituberculatus]